MKIKEYTLEATIGLPDYSNVKPSITLTGSEPFSDLHREATNAIKNVWSQYGKSLPITSNDRVLLEAYVGGRVGYDQVAHVYTNPDDPNDVYMSGSQYADSFRKPFDKQTIAGAMAKKSGGKAEDIIAKWELKSKASRDFGTAVHEALEYHQLYGEPLSNPILKEVSESFYTSHKGKALSEVLIVDHKAKRAGQIDRLEILGEKHGRVCDYKTGEVKDKLPVWLKQCEFYSGIMEAAGWKMEPPIIYNWNGKWVEYK